MLCIEESVLTELFDGLLALTGYITECEGRVDIDDGEAEAVERMELHLDLHEDIHAGLEALAGLGLEIGV